MFPHWLRPLSTGQKKQELNLSGVIVYYVGSAFKAAVGNFAHRNRLVVIRHLCICYDVDGKLLFGIGSGQCIEGKRVKKTLRKLFWDDTE